MSTIFHMFHYTFIMRAFIVGLLISLCAAMLGVNLVLRKNAMISDGLSHVSFGSFAIATVLGVTPLWIAIPVAVIAAVAILKLNDHHHIHGDGAIAILSSSSLAIGIMAISVTQGVNTDINNYLFGSILSLDNQDMLISIILSVVVFILYIFSYHKMFALTFDEDFAKSTGINVEFYNVIIAILCSLTIVLGMRMMGALLISSLTIFPCLTSMYFCKDFKSVVISSAILSSICFVIGLFISYFYATPTGASIVIINLIVLCIVQFTHYVTTKS